jgi:hypothetical protein
MGALVCRVELNKEKGLILTVENKDGKITQTAVLDGDVITITCKGNGEEKTSTITQKPESIEIKCKEFTLDADTITCTSKEDSTYESKGANVTVSAKSKAELKGMNTTIDGSTKTEVKGMDLKLSGTTKAEMDGLKVKISSNTMLDLEATGIVNLKGQMANVKGTLTKVG